MSSQPFSAAGKRKDTAPHDVRKQRQRGSWLNRLALARLKNGANPVYVSSVNANRLVELLACDVKVMRPVSNVGGHFGVDDLGIMRAFCRRLFMQSMGFVAVLRFFLGIAVFGDDVPLSGNGKTIAMIRLCTHD